MKTGEGKSPMQLSVELASSSVFNSLRKFQMEWQILLAMGITSVILNKSVSHQCSLYFP